MQRPNESANQRSKRPISTTRWYDVIDIIESSELVRIRPNSNISRGFGLFYLEIRVSFECDSTLYSKRRTKRWIRTKPHLYIYISEARVKMWPDGRMRYIANVAKSHQIRKCDHPVPFFSNSTTTSLIFISLNHLFQYLIGIILPLYSWTFQGG